MSSLDPSTGEWQTYLRHNLPGYRFLSDTLRDKLCDLMRRFLSEISFESPERMEVTDEMRILVSGHACLLLVGETTEFYKLEKVLLYHGKFTRNGSRWTSYYDGSGEIHFAWKELQKGTERNIGWNPALFRFADALYSATGWRGQEQVFERWFGKYQKTSELGKTEKWQPQDLNDVDHALIHFTQLLNQIEVIHVFNSSLVRTLRGGRSFPCRRSHKMV